MTPGEATVTPGEEHPGEHWWDVDLPRAPMGGTLGLRARSKDGVVTGVRATVGGQHRGVEGLAEGHRFGEVPTIVARAAPRSSVHWQVAYAEAVEALCHIQVPSRGKALRVALMELERIADHMLHHASMLELLGCRASAARVWADRELVMDGTQVLTGQRIVQDAVVVGGVLWDAHESWSGRLRSVAGLVRSAVHEYVHEAEALGPLSRLEGLAPVHLEDMRGWGLSGPLLRSVGIPRDARTDGRCRSYEDVSVSVQTREAGDAMARSELRLLEMAASARTMDQVARSMPGGRVRAMGPDAFPKGHGWGVAECPRGEVACLVVSDGTDRPRRVKLRSPDLAHTAALVDLLLGCPEDDVALAVASIDICVGGVDR
jgi:NADH:ubiquinone oxidoreductase subunit D